MWDKYQTQIKSSKIMLANEEEHVWYPIMKKDL